MLKILCIGNSFSDDATRYLYPIADAAGTPLKLYNLYIGGCSLAHHYRLMRSGAADYAFRFNSMDTGLNISMQQALAADDWDVVTLQQASHFSHKYDTYQPYLNELAAYVRSFVPKTRLLIHQTWAYEQGSQRLTQELGYADQADMFRDVKASYAQAAQDIHAAGILPSGEMMQALLSAGIFPVHRDTFHAGYGLPRYALAAVWFELLTGRTIVGNPMRKLDVPADEPNIPLAQRLAHEVAAGSR